MKEFDLNIQKILENWEIYHAIREIISNALDEQNITNTKEIEIYHEAGDYSTWHVRDYGRGIDYHHLTQNENYEKIHNEKLIGKFGVGLKDALATLYRNNVGVEIISQHGIITLKNLTKVGFDDIQTIHAVISDNDCLDFQGTDIVLTNCKESDIQTAKSLFLKYNDCNLLECTEYGEIYENDNGIASIYINGVKVAEEQNFLFSYNITTLSKAIKKELNRERNNIGRAAYAERIKTILLNASDQKVISMLIEDLKQFGNGLRHDEVTWVDVGVYASKKMSQINEKSVFVNAMTAMDQPSVIDDMRLRGYHPIIIPQKLESKINYNNMIDSDAAVLTTKEFVSKMRHEMKIDYVDIDELNDKEKEVFGKKDQIIDMIGGMLPVIKDIRIAQTIDGEIYDGIEVRGLWRDGIIIIKRSLLSDLSQFAGTLIHEYVHAKSGYEDVSRDFENVLTDMLGLLADSVINNASKEKNKETVEVIKKDQNTMLILVKAFTDLYKLGIYAQKKGIEFGDDLRESVLHLFAVFENDIVNINKLLYDSCNEEHQINILRFLKSQLNMTNMDIFETKENAKDMSKSELRKYMNTPLRIIELANSLEMESDSELISGTTYNLFCSLRMLILMSIYSVPSEEASFTLNLGVNQTLIHYEGYFESYRKKFENSDLCCDEPKGVQMSAPTLDDIQNTLISLDDSELKNKCLNLIENIRVLIEYTDEEIGINDEIEISLVQECYDYSAIDDIYELLNDSMIEFGYDISAYI